MIRCAHLLLACILLTAVPLNTHAAGVTVVTHGFSSSIGPWITPMVDAMMRYAPLTGANATCYLVNITRSGGEYFADATLHAGNDPLATSSGEILILLNWSTLSTTLGVSTVNIANATAAALQSTALIPALGGRALAELPLHLAGHSRGASVAAETARLLGAQGIWVDQLTSWDAVPVSLFYNDPAMKNYANILYTDNYWQNIGSPSGPPLPGAYNRRLTNLDSTDAHSEVHLWYHGTIDFTTPLTVDGLTANETERQNWWSPFEERGTNAGFRLSRIGGGDRLSEVEPVGPGLGRISDGFNRVWDLGAGVAPNRDALPANNGAWPNPIRVLHTAANPLPAGAGIPVALYYQFGANPSAAAHLHWSLDLDRNVFNTNELSLGTASVLGTGPNAVFLLSTNLPTASLTIPAGQYWLRASLTLTNRTRHFYAAQPITIAPSLAPPLLTALGLTNGHFHLLIEGETGQRIVTEASTNFVEWNAIATNHLTTSFSEVWDTAAGDFEQRYYRAVLSP